MDDPLKEYCVAFWPGADYHSHACVDDAFHYGRCLCSCGATSHIAIGKRDGSLSKEVLEFGLHDSIAAKSPGKVPFVGAYRGPKPYALPVNEGAPRKPRRHVPPPIERSINEPQTPHPAPQPQRLPGRKYGRNPRTVATVVVGDFFVANRQSTKATSIEVVAISDMKDKAECVYYPSRKRSMIPVSTLCRTGHRGYTYLGTDPGQDSNDGRGVQQAL